MSLLREDMATLQNNTKAVFQMQGIGFGVGLSICPALGALFYYYFGFIGPCVVLTLLFGVTTLLVDKYVPEASQASLDAEAREKKEKEEASAAAPLSVFEVFPYRIVWFTMASVFLSHIQGTYIDPTIAPYVL